MKPSVLIVDDETDTLDSLSEFLTDDGYATDTADCLKAAQDVMAARQVDAVLLDMNLPDGNGLDWIQTLREQQPHLAIIVITGVGDIPTAVDAMRRGADQFLTKPVNPDELTVFLARCLEVERLRRRDAMRRRLTTGASTYRGESPKIHEAWQLAATAAENDAAILLLGETGTGKGIFARCIHDTGARREEPYVELNCSSLGGDLLASELFGHRKGAFTSAVEDREGLVEAANGGTLFLDEIGDMDLAVQAQFLKVLEEKKFRRVGESKQRRSDFRLICATNRDLTAACDKGLFRRDLYFRICIFPIEIPPLRHYAADLPGLIEHLLAVLGRPKMLIQPETMRMLQTYDWPGNIRELRNVLERACILARSEPLHPRHFPGLDTKSTPAPRGSGAYSARDMKNHEALYFRQALAHFDGDVHKAAQALGVSRATFYRKLKSNPDLPTD